MSKTSKKSRNTKHTENVDIKGQLVLSHGQARVIYSGIGQNDPISLPSHIIPETLLIYTTEGKNVELHDSLIFDGNQSVDITSFCGKNQCYPLTFSAFLAGVTYSFIGNIIIDKDNVNLLVNCSIVNTTKERLPGSIVIENMGEGTYMKTIDPIEKQVIFTVDNIISPYICYYVYETSGANYSTIVFTVSNPIPPMTLNYYRHDENPSTVYLGSSSIMCTKKGEKVSITLHEPHPVKVTFNLFPPTTVSGGRCQKIIAIAVNESSSSVKIMLKHKYVGSIISVIPDKYSLNGNYIEWIFTLPPRKEGKDKERIEMVVVTHPP